MHISRKYNGDCQDAPSGNVRELCTSRATPWPAGQYAESGAATEVLGEDDLMGHGTRHRLQPRNSYNQWAPRESVIAADFRAARQIVHPRCPQFIHTWSRRLCTCLSTGRICATRIYVTRKIPKTPWGSEACAFVPRNSTEFSNNKGQN